jgi:hypothetical protein
MSENSSNKSIFSGLVPANYLNIALDARNTNEKEKRILFEKVRFLPLDF